LVLTATPPAKNTSGCVFGCARFSHCATAPLPTNWRTAAARGDLTDALKHANDSLEILLNLSDNEGNAGPTAAIYLLRANLKSRVNCREALPDYDKALELYGRLSEFSVNSYQIHKGKLFCFQQLNEHDDFSRELETV
jgi:tetratricopeptide (TPR) repeat protein